MKKNGNRYEVESAGLGEQLFFYDDVSCGEIKHGVALEIGNTGPFAISFSDLEKMYNSAISARNKRFKQEKHP